MPLFTIHFTNLRLPLLWSVNPTNLIIFPSSFRAPPKTRPTANCFFISVFPSAYSLLLDFKLIHNLADIQSKPGLVNLCEICFFLLLSQKWQKCQRGKGLDEDLIQTQNKQSKKTMNLCTWKRSRRLMKLYLTLLFRQLVFNESRHGRSVSHHNSTRLQLHGRPRPLHS